ncbi:cysteine--1-D-myo-inosityl 2-amino-2-deoxy-alpha-D-glucopyranoside ligase [Nocardioides yefusunii]|uniref:L-cysteine:1D-myo-inositol 2-amino-2-deoxy-alpha-D-glucopyranoside ligase n=1 Tax=Nocardioides yefusunii TaxID=2500546 RepID=A0ABW1QU06_9ACTN|nr:cysteine--1-D-myo-inosityl 2-amino-2-deoxy-alpha-D-glucopyranoside ligase [Nocardioides yefusunii]
MRAWSAPDVPVLPVSGPEVSIHDTATGRRVTPLPEGPARLYVCGITPYDATHMGHAATYVAFDLLNRAWRAAGHDVTYVQNVTDVDDPLLERATKVNVDWVELAERETELFRQDMLALRVLPPAHYIGAVESIPLVISYIEGLQAKGAVYELEGDLYFRAAADPAYGQVSHYSHDEMLAIFAERGGDPERPGKENPFDSIVWLAERPGEPSWESPFGKGRPGWHIECTAIAQQHLGDSFDVQAGGSDLVFPHHEMCASTAAVASGKPFAEAYAHAGMVAYDGEKMSKSKGNLVFVSQLRNSDVDPMAIRFVLLNHHYRSDWEWQDADLFGAVDTLERWRRALSLGAGAPAAPVVDAVLAAMADDLDAPAAIRIVDEWVNETLGTAGLADASDPDAAHVIHRLLDASLGLSL